MYVKATALPVLSRRTSRMNGTTVCTQINISKNRHPEQSMRNDSEVTPERSQNRVSVKSVHVQSGRLADAFRDRPMHRQTREHRQKSGVGRQTCDEDAAVVLQLG